MSFGLRTYDNLGNIKLTQDKKTCRLVARFVAIAGESGSGEADLTNVTNPSFIAQPLDGDQYYRHLTHLVTLNKANGLVEWRPQEFENVPGFAPEAQWVHSSTLILVFGYG